MKNLIKNRGYPKRILTIIICLIFILPILLTFDNQKARAAPPTTAKAFYDWLNSQSHLTVNDVVYVQETDTIMMVAKGTKGAGAITYGTIGWQVRVHLPNRKLWTIIPLASGYMEQISEETIREGSTDYVYTLWSMKYKSGSNSLMNILKRDFPQYASEIDGMKLGNIYFDAILTIKNYGTPRGYLDSNRVPQGEVYMTRGWWSPSPSTPGSGYGVSLYDADAEKPAYLPRYTYYDTVVKSYRYVSGRITSGQAWSGAAQWTIATADGAWIRYNKILKPAVIDTTPPSVWFTPNNATWQRAVTVQVNASDNTNVDSIEYQIKRNYEGWPSGWANIGNGGTFTINQTGIWEGRAVAYDTSGNSNSTWAGYWYVDATPPRRQSTTISGAAYVNGNDYWVKPNTTINIWDRGYDGESGIYYSYLRLSNGSTDNRAEHMWGGSSTNIREFFTSSNITITGVTESSNSGGYKAVTWQVKPIANDMDFDVESTYYDAVWNIYGYEDTGLNIRVDGTAPSGTFSPNSSEWGNGDIAVTFNPSDSRSGVKQWRYRTSNNGTTWGAWSSYITGDTNGVINLTSQGQWKIQVEVTDNVGNVAIVTSGTYNIDKTAPTYTRYWVENITPWEYDIVIEGVADSGGSGLKGLSFPTWTDANGQDELNTRQFVIRAYQNYLGRDPDNDGLTYYMGQLNSAAMTEVDVVLKIINSSEFKGRNVSNTDFVKYTYRVLLNREPDTDGLNWYTQELNNGHITRDGLVTVIGNSDEHKDRDLGGKNLGGGKYRYKVRIYEHNSEKQDYITHIYLRDNAGNITVVGVYVDVPSAININPPSSNWTSSITATVTITDSTEGIKLRQYKWTTSTSKPSSWDTASSNVFTTTQSSQGIWYLHVQTWDNKDAYDYTYAGPYRIDKIAPAVTDNNVLDGYDSVFAGGVLNYGTFLYGGTPSNLSVATGGYNGYNYLKITGSGQGDSGAYLYIDNLKTNTNYTLSAQIRVAKSGTNFGNGALFVVNKANNQGLAAKSPSPQAGSWTKVELTFNTGSNDAIYLRFTRGDVPEFHVTDIRLVEGSTASPTIGKSITVALNYADAGGSGIKDKQYAWSTSSTTQPTTWTNYTGQVTQTNEGVWYLWYRATDNAGNVTINKCGPYTVDLTPPSGTFNPNGYGWTKDNINVTFTPTDDKSGVQKWRYALETNPSNWSSYFYGNSSRIITVSSNTVVRIIVEVTDNVGNTATLYSNKYYIDKDKPVITPYPAGASTSGEVVNKVDATIVDTASGLKSVYYKWTYTNNAISDLNGFSSLSVGQSSQYSMVPTLIGDNVYLHIKAYDNVGNEGYVIWGPYSVGPKINGLSVTNIVKPVKAYSLPAVCPLMVPIDIKTGYDVTLNVDVDGADTVELSFYVNGQPATIYGADKYDNNTIRKTTTSKNVPFTVYFDEKIPLNSIIDIKITAKRGNIVVVNDQLGYRVFKVVGSLQKDLYINNIH